MTCSETHTAVRTTTDLAIPIRTIDIVSIGQYPTRDVECSSDSLVPLSLNQLKAGEIIQRMHSDANNLLCSIQGLLHYRTLSATGGGHIVPNTILGNPKLLNVQRLSQEITGDMGELVALSRREAKDTMRDLGQARKMRRNHRVMERHRAHHPDMNSPVQLVCHTCNARRTPQWRSGPAGPCTLCNVCGLIHAMRLRKQGRIRSKKVSASSYIS
ncbi:GATA zinc finger domain-containing protein 7 [Colletotrichum spaethianum]|uniref:GATA zinc finger domain-containing protein 7 n=1 Tax=Colletotrichum spaethianum TaxID=700344 RepID=A0AA37UN23_9PEZI|nr:GATA zinc finger domain-containing protein 7 [Colletotrichum spaethianum]GKT47730.1 GATA zinc finger domain-containing protein 7 [Colletotrichum spaethianum]